MTHLRISSLGLALAVVGGSALLGCSTHNQAPADSVARARCGELTEVQTVASEHLGPGRVTSVAPIKVNKFHARALQSEHTMGAELVVPAQKGMTAEYLERALTCHAASGSPVSAQDPLHPDTGRIASVDVRSSHGSFVVRALGDSPDAGDAIWNRARSYTNGPVTVEQVGSVEAESWTGAAKFAQTGVVVNTVDAESWTGAPKPASVSVEQVGAAESPTGSRF